LRYQKRPQISKSLDIVKSDIHNATKNKAKTFKKSNTSQHSQEIQSIDPNFFTITPINTYNESLEEEYYLPSIDLSHWKDEWRVYAEMISKVIIKKSKYIYYYLSIYGIKLNI